MTKYANVISYSPTSLAVIFNEMNGYYIVGRCLSGSRHYSELLTWDEVETEFDKYVAVVNYFGGGTVEVYTSEGDICRSRTVANFDF